MWVDLMVGWQPDLGQKAELAKVVLGMAHEEAPDPRRPLDTLYDEKTGSLATYSYQFQVSMGCGTTCSQCVGI